MSRCESSLARPVLARGRYDAGRSGRRRPVASTTVRVHPTRYPHGSRSGSRTGRKGCRRRSTVGVSNQISVEVEFHLYRFHGGPSLFSCRQMRSSSPALTHQLTAYPASVYRCDPIVPSASFFYSVIRAREY